MNTEVVRLKSPRKRNSVSLQAVEGEKRFWEVSDTFWAKVEPLIPQPERESNKVYVRKPGGGKKPKPSRLVFEGILYALRTGCQWKALPKEIFGSSSAIHAHFVRWRQAGFFAALWQAGLAECDEMEGIVWRWQKVDCGRETAPAQDERAALGSSVKRKKREPAQSQSRREWAPVVATRNRKKA